MFASSFRDERYPSPAIAPAWRGYAAAAVLAVLVCVLVDLRVHPVGRMRTALWGGGLAVYGILLRRAIGPAIDWRDRDRSR